MKPYTVFRKIFNPLVKIRTSNEFAQRRNFFKIVTLMNLGLFISNFLNIREKFDYGSFNTTLNVI
jgi:hypothetical protein